MEVKKIYEKSILKDKKKKGGFGAKSREEEGEYQVKDKARKDGKGWMERKEDRNRGRGTD